MMAFFDPTNLNLTFLWFGPFSRFFEVNFLQDISLPSRESEYNKDVTGEGFFLLFSL